eukprot:m51a1_g4521 putative transcription initiation factor tfiid subunit 8 isoform x2 (285) ;mRNA; f:432610-433983
MAELFAQRLLRISTAQLVRSTGYDAIQHSSLEFLTDLLQDFIQEAGALAHRHAEAAGRTESNAFDAVVAVHELHQPLDALREFRAVHGRVIAPFPVLSRPPTGPEKQLRDVRGPPPPHIPEFLPPYPDRHTYAFTPVNVPRTVDHNMLRRERAKQQRKVDETHKRLNQLIPAPRSSVEPTHAEPSEEPMPARQMSDDEERKAAAGGGAGAEAPAIAVLALDDTDVAKKRLKCEQILRLQHLKGVDESLTGPIDTGLSAQPGGAVVGGTGDREESESGEDDMMDD